MPKIKVYTTPTCTYCIVLKKYLGEKGFDYEEVDISENDEERKRVVEKTGQMGVPVTEVNGEFIVGFEKGKLNKALGIEK